MPNPIAPGNKIKLRPKVAFRYFALLDHFWGDEVTPAAAVKLQKLLTAVSFLTPTDVATTPALQTSVKSFFDVEVKNATDAVRTELAGPLGSAARKEKQSWLTSLMRLAYLRFAVVNLKDPAHPTFAGNLGVDADPGAGGNGTVDPKRKEAPSGEKRCLETWEAASTGKIAVLYAAHQLRFDLLALAARNPGWKDDKELFDGALMEWEKSQATNWAAVDKLSEAEVDARSVKVKTHDPEVRVLDDRVVLVTRKGEEKKQWSQRVIPLHYGPPALDRIFDAQKDAVTGAWAITFKGQPSDADLPKRQLALVPAANAFSSPLPAHRADGKAMTFFDHLWLMIDASHNHATSKCIGAIGYLYINSVLWQTGLFDLGRNGGLWIGWDYWTDHWAPPPVADPPRRTPDGDVIYAAISAAAGCHYMTLLRTDRLVNKQACARMRIFLDRRTNPPKKKNDAKDKRDHPAMHFDDPLFGTTDRSPIGDAVRALVPGADFNPDAFDELYSKIGLGGRKNVWDVAGVERKAGPKKLRYGEMVIDSDGGAPLFVIAQALDNCVENNT